MVRTKAQATRRRRRGRSPQLIAVAGGAALAVAAYGTASAMIDETGDKPRGTVSASPAALPSASASTSPPTAIDKVATAQPKSAAPASLANRLELTTVTLPKKLSYLEGGYNRVPEWTRVDTAVAADGTVRVAWPAADGVHVTTLTKAMKRSGSDTVVAGAKEIGGLMAHNDGFALLTRVADSNKWKETAAAVIRYKNGKRAFTRRLTGAASHDTAPVLDGQLKWNGSKYGAYFVVHGAGGPADGHFGDKLAYVSARGAKLGGGWNWGCSHNEGIALFPEQNGPFTSLCHDDWRSGLFVSTGIGAPETAPVVQREECWAGYCGGTFPGRTGALVKSATGRYATAFGSRGAAKAVKNPDDATGRGWKVTPRWKTHQVAVAFLKNRSTPAGKPVYLTNVPGTEHVNVRIAPYGRDRLLVSWETLANPRCAKGTCTGRFTGTRLRLIDYDGKFRSRERLMKARLAGDIGVLPDGDLVWAYASATPDYEAPLSSSPTTAKLTVARLNLSAGG
ncbi:hypothetical protein [Streptomyces sp. KR80]|uniref:hypothetical protein n=1 Tax=Streptomyces sp. KR80 TaxID=3457426 RepID=UPI003FD5F4AF